MIKTFFSLSQSSKTAVVERQLQFAYDTHRFVNKYNVSKKFVFWPLRTRHHLIMVSFFHPGHYVVHCCLLK